MENIALYNRFSEWLQTATGENILKAESAAVQSVLDKISKQSILLIGLNIQTALIQSNRFKHSTFITPMSLNSTPVSDDIFDTIVLLHTLELVANPFSLLEKVTRALRADGHLIILHFNPWSLWGISRLFSFHKQKMPYALKSYSPFQIKQWLETFHFEIDSEKSAFYYPLIKTEKSSLLLNLLKCLRFSFFGSIHLYVAKKKTIYLTPLKTWWKPLLHWTIKDWKPAPTQGAYHRE